MSYPVLFNRIEEDYETQGYGFLSDAISCEMTEEINGQYEVVMKYPTTGIHFSDIQNRRILSVKTPYESVSGKTKQLFRIYYISEPLKGAVEIRAAHISYDLSGYPVEPFSVDDLDSALDGLTYNSVISCPFTLLNAKENIVKRFSVDEPSTIRSCMMGEEGSILDRYRGEWVFDNFNCYLYNKRGENRGVTLRYGKNLIGLTQEKQSDEQYSHIVAFARYTITNGEERVKRGHVITVDDTIRPRQVFLLDMSEAYRESIPTRADLDSNATEFAENNSIDELDTTYTIDWIQLPDVKETVTLGDTIKVYYHGATYTARVIAYTWDVLKDRYKNIEVGKKKRGMYDTIKSVASVGAKKAAENIVLSNGDCENLIYNGVRTSTANTNRPNILGDRTHGEPGGVNFLNQSFFKLWYNNPSAENVVEREAVSNGFKLTFKDGTYSDGWFLSPKSVTRAAAAMIGFSYRWDSFNNSNHNLYADYDPDDHTKLIPVVTPGQSSGLVTTVSVSPNTSDDNWERWFNDNYDKLYNYINSSDESLTDAEIFVGDLPSEYLEDNYSGSLPLGTYTFSLDVESDFWKNYEVLSAKQALSDKLILQIFPIVKIVYTGFKTDREGRIYTGTQTLWGKPTNYLQWKYSERAQTKRGRLSCTFKYDLMSYTEQEFSQTPLPWNSGSFLYNRINLSLGIGGYCNTSLWTPKKEEGGENYIQKTGTADSFIKITNIQLESGKKATVYRPGIYDTYRGISSDAINALF